MCRTEKPIDWGMVDELLEAGCLGTEIASYFSMHPHTFYDRVLDKYKITFTEYSCYKKPKGEALIRLKQYKKALKGDNAMLIHLGKYRLNQKEDPMETNKPNEAHQVVIQDVKNGAINVQSETGGLPESGHGAP